MADSRTRAGKIQDESGSSCSPESKEVHKEQTNKKHKCTENLQDIRKGHKRQMEKFPIANARTI